MRRSGLSYDDNQYSLFLSQVAEGNKRKHGVCCSLNVKTVKVKPLQLKVVTGHTQQTMLNLTIKSTMKFYIKMRSMFDHNQSINTQFRKHSIKTITATYPKISWYYSRYCLPLISRYSW